MASERLIILVNEKGSRVVRRGFDNIGEGASKARGATDLLRRSLGILGGGLIIRQLVKTADTFTLIQNRLKIVTDSTGELNAVTEELFQVSQRTRTGFEANAELFQRFSAATKNLGLKQGDLLKVVESINQAVTISGVTSIEAAQALRQLAQGIGSSELRGQELRSILEQLPKVADVIAKKFGVGRAELLKFGEEGKISARKVIEAFQESAPELAETFAELDVTVGQAIQRIKNAFITFVGRINKASGTTAFLAKALSSLAVNFETFARVLGATAIFGILVKGFAAATAAVRAFTVALATNPIGLIALALTAVVAALTTFSDKIRISKSELSTIADFGKAAFNVLKQAVEGFVIFFNENFPVVLEFLRSIFGEFELSFVGVLQLFAAGIDGIVGIISGLVNAVKALFDKGLIPALKFIFNKFINFLIFQFENFFFGPILSSINKIGEFFGKTFDLALELPKIPLSEGGKDLGKILGEAFNQGVLESTGAGDILEETLRQTREITAARLAREREEAQKDGFQLETGAGLQETFAPAGVIKDILKDLEQQLRIVRLTNAERKIENDFLKITKRLKGGLREEDEKDIKNRLEQIRLAKIVAKAVKAAQGETFDLAAATEELKKQLGEAAVGTELFQTALRDLQLQAVETGRSFEAGLARGIISIKDSMTDVATATENLLVNAFNNAEDALVEFVQTGKIDFKSFVDSVLADLTRLLIRQALLAFLTPAAPGPGLGGAAAIAQLVRNNPPAPPGFEHGGFAHAGRPVVVGEGGPEIFNPTVSGRISPMPPAEPPQVNLTVVNVTDPDDAVAAISTPPGEQAIVNVIRRQRRGIQQILG